MIELTKGCGNINASKIQTALETHSLSLRERVGVRVGVPLFSSESP
jgi:hypothetical protein